jgi:hypothetical protein
MMPWIRGIRKGQRHTKSFGHEELTLANLKSACVTHFNMPPGTCDVLVSNKGPSCTINSEFKQVTFLTTRTAWVTSEDWVKGCDWWKTSTLLPVDVRVVKNVTCSLISHRKDKVLFYTLYWIKLYIIIYRNELTSILYSTANSDSLFGPLPPPPVL